MLQSNYVEQLTQQLTDKFDCSTHQLSTKAAPEIKSQQGFYKFSRNCISFE